MARIAEMDGCWFCDGLVLARKQKKGYNVLKVDIVDARGIKRRMGILSPHDDPKEGIPLDVYNDLEDYYQDIPETFLKNLLSRLWDMGLIEAQDFQSPTAANRYRQALQLAMKSDATNAIRFILNLSMEQAHGNSHK